MNVTLNSMMVSGQQAYETVAIFMTFLIVLMLRTVPSEKYLKSMSASPKAAIGVAAAKAH